MNSSVVGALAKAHEQPEEQGVNQPPHHDWRNAHRQRVPLRASNPLGRHECRQKADDVRMLCDDLEQGLVKCGCHQARTNLPVDLNRIRQLAGAEQHPGGVDQ